MTKQTPAEIIAAMPHTLVYAYTTLYGITVMPEKHAEDCAVCQLAAANSAYLEIVVQVAMDATVEICAHDDIRWTNDGSSNSVPPLPPTVAEVLAAADAKYRAG